VRLQAFAAVGTMEGAWYTATGEPRSFSEQQLIDCAWPHGPHGCDGGDYQVCAEVFVEHGSRLAVVDFSRKLLTGTLPASAAMASYLFVDLQVACNRLKLPGNSTGC
jgi:hypothetical protein